MQKIYTKKTPFGHFRSDRPLSHGVSIFLIIQSILYFTFAFLAFCGILYKITDPEIIFKLENCHSLEGFGYALLDTVTLIGENTLVYYGVAIGLFTSLAVISVVIAVLRIAAFEKYLMEVKYFALLEDPANDLTEQDRAFALSFALGSPEASETDEPQTDRLIALQEQSNRDILNLFNIVGTGKRGEIFLHSSRLLRENAKIVTDPDEQDKLSALSEKYYAHHLKNRTMQIVQGDAMELLSSLNVTAKFSHRSTEGDGHVSSFTVTVPETIQQLTDGSDAVIDGLFRVSVKAEDEVIAKLVCLLPMNGSAEPCSYKGYYPTTADDQRLALFIEPISLWLMEKP